MHKLTEYEKNVITWEKRDIWLDVILLSFDKPIVYDYPIPDKHRTNIHTGNVFKKLNDSKKIPKSLAELLFKHVWSAKDDYSDLENRLSWDHIFGNEWFYGYGDLYRWRNGEREKALARVDKHIPKNYKRYIPVIQDALKLKFDKIEALSVEAFELDKILEK